MVTMVTMLTMETMVTKVTMVRYYGNHGDHLACVLASRSWSKESEIYLYEKKIHFYIEKFDGKNDSRSKDRNDENCL